MKWDSWCLCERKYCPRLFINAPLSLSWQVCDCTLLVLVEDAVTVRNVLKKSLSWPLGLSPHHSSPAAYFPSLCAASIPCLSLKKMLQVGLSHCPWSLVQQPPRNIHIQITEAKAAWMKMDLCMKLERSSLQDLLLAPVCVLMMDHCVSSLTVLAYIHVVFVWTPPAVARSARK